MEVVSFFSAKGGTGKTTFNLLFASYLSYICKKRVLMLDFDGPEYNALLTRKRELVPARKKLDVTISVVFVLYSEEYILIEKI